MGATTPTSPPAPQHRRRRTKLRIACAFSRRAQGGSGWQVRCWDEWGLATPAFGPDAVCCLLPSHRTSSVLCEIVVYISSIEFYWIFCNDFGDQAVDWRAERRARAYVNLRLRLWTDEMASSVISQAQAQHPRPQSHTLSNCQALAHHPAPHSNADAHDHSALLRICCGDTRTTSLTTNIHTQIKTQIHRATVRPSHLVTVTSDKTKRSLSAAPLPPSPCTT